MENLINTINLAEISYPVYNVIGNHRPLKDGLITYTFSVSGYKDEEPISKIRLIDDKSIKEPTLGKRRLQLLAQGVELAKLGKAMFFLADLIKLAKSNHHFIDSNGKVFVYKKSTRANLTFKKIQHIFPIETGGAIIEVQGLPQRFKCLFMPKSHETYAGILHWGKSTILYGLYDRKYADTWRKV